MSVNCWIALVIDLGGRLPLRAVGDRARDGECGRAGVGQQIRTVPKRRVGRREIRLVRVEIGLDLGLLQDQPIQIDGLRGGGRDRRSAT